MLVVDYQPTDIRVTHGISAIMLLFAHCREHTSQVKSCTHVHIMVLFLAGTGVNTGSWH